MFKKSKIPTHWREVGGVLWAVGNIQGAQAKDLTTEIQHMIKYSSEYSKHIHRLPEFREV